jgi:hypothetical protein
MAGSTSDRCGVTIIQEVLAAMRRTFNELKADGYAVQQLKEFDGEKLGICRATLSRSFMATPSSRPASTCLLTPTSLARHQTGQVRQGE